MTRLDPTNPHQVAHEIARLTEVMEDTTHQYGLDIREAAQLSAVFKGEWARAMLIVIAASPPKTTVAEKDAHCEVEVNEKRIIAEIAESKAKATKSALDSLRVQIDALRSLGANLRIQT
tara:strand:- start:44 stop:400 length:357 start_codon:yes stop_codon:yes gene_type:complete